MRNEFGNATTRRDVTVAECDGINFNGGGYSRACEKVITKETKHRTHFRVGIEDTILAAL